MPTLIEQAEEIVKKTFVEVTLRDGRGEKVIDAELHLPRQVNGHLPEVVIWRDRIYHFSHTEAERPIYQPAQVSMISWYLERGKFRG
jgi:hypothetical protein